MITVRAIHPAAFKSSVFREDTNKVLMDVAGGMLKDYNRTVQTWKKKPKFETKTDTGVGTGGKASITVETTDPVYGYVDQGTKKHVIRPKRKRALIFNSKFKPKTGPMSLQSGPGLSAPPVVGARVVHHPGTKPRNFNKRIKQKWEPEYKRQMKNALARATRRCGHSVK